MKKTLALILALAMVLGTMAALTVGVAAEDTASGTAGTVVVYKQDFESFELGVKPTGWSGPAWANMSVAVDATNGSKYVKVGNISAAYIAGGGRQWDESTGDWYKKDGVNYTNIRWASELLGGRISDSSKWTYLDGKTYDYVWDGVAVDATGQIAAGSGSSGINGMGTGKLISWSDANTATTVNQWYGQALYHYVDGNKTKSFTGKTTTAIPDSKWKTFGYSDMVMRIGTVSGGVPTYVASSSVNGMFYEWSNIANAALPILLEHKAYYGNGISSGGGKFTITAEDLCGHEKRVSRNGTSFAVAEDGTDPLIKEWDMSEDCSPLTCTDETCQKRFNAFKTAFDNADIQIGMDNVLVTADAMLYTDTVNVAGNATVKAVTNTFLNNEETVANGGTVETNDYWGTKYIITPAAGSELVSVTYNGEALTPTTASGVSTVTIAPEAITADGVLDVKVGKEIVIFYEDFEDAEVGKTPAGWGKNSSDNPDLLVHEENGNKFLAYDNWDAEKLMAAAAKYTSEFTKNMTKPLANTYPRISFDQHTFKIYPNVEYKQAYNFAYTSNGAMLSGHTQNQPFFNLKGGSADRYKNWTSYASNTGNRTQFYLGGTTTSGTDWHYATTSTLIVTEMNNKRKYPLKPYDDDGDGVNDTDANGKELVRETPDETATPVEYLGVSNTQPEFKALNQTATSRLNELTYAALESTKTEAGAYDKDAAAAALVQPLAEADLEIHLDNFAVTVVGIPANIKGDVDANAVVKVNTLKLADEGVVEVPEGFESTISVEAKEGYVINSITVDGTPIPAVDGELSKKIQNVFNGDSVIKVVTRLESVEAAASVGITKADTYEGNLSLITYVDVTRANSWNWADMKYGVDFTDAQGNVVPLPAKGLANLGEDVYNAKFAVRLYGSAISAGNTYKFTPWVQATESGSKISGAESSVEVE